MITVHVLTGVGHEQRATSACMPGFDLALVGEMLALPSLSAVRKALRDNGAVQAMIATA